jgi:glycine oxidase
MKVVIVGAGVAGLSIGLRLLQAGAQVTVLERAQPTRGATWAAAGMISVVGDHADANAAETAFARCAASLWPEFALELEDLTGRSLGYRRDGKLIIARNPEEYMLLAARAQDCPELAMMTKDQARALEPMLRDDIAGALWDESEAQVDNRMLGVALTQAYLRAGGVLQTNESVVRVECDATHVQRLLTPFASYEGDACVLAAGAWTSRIEGLAPDVLPPVVPVKGEMISLSGGALPGRIVWGEDVYLVPRAGALLVGATAEQAGFDTRLTDEARIWLRGQAASVLPAVSGWDLVEQWAGLRPSAPDGLPILGRTALDGLFVASGQYRNGILFAPAIAKAVSAVVLGQEPRIDISSFTPLRFSNAALAKGKAVG